MDSTENHQEMLYENALKKPNMDNHQLDADKKQIQTNEGIEDIKQDEQAAEAVAKNNASDVVETVTEQTVTGGGQCSERYLEMGAAECVSNINADPVIMPLFIVSPGGSGQSVKRNEATKQYYKKKPNSIKEIIVQS
ncbi:hypothetical protein T11_204 [Trichinella zimbabwensis]|uniref:Uncharacterized protein n=1 Tax=Trichinella zimbabwensis TaxID=268475 RepID=A0A0V1HRZ9_9BILA|nr:hypothetical protein T11_204 [Trichinella zimbabwensis]KRZ13287.1 hypothetical protein T11_204 [Trichinella zimbabwensis]